jgi:hypothetical protein
LWNTPEIIELTLHSGIKNVSDLALATSFILTVTRVNGAAFRAQPLVSQASLWINE